MPTTHTFTCATCDHVIAAHPVFHIGLSFCCAGCAADGPCMCSYDLAAPTPSLELVEPTVDAVAGPVGGRVLIEPLVREPSAVPAVAAASAELVAVAG